MHVARGKGRARCFVERERGRLKKEAVAEAGGGVHVQVVRVSCTALFAGRKVIGTRYGMTTSRYTLLRWRVEAGRQHRLTNQPLIESMSDDQRDRYRSAPAGKTESG